VSPCVICVHELRIIGTEKVNFNETRCTSANGEHQLGNDSLERLSYVGLGFGVRGILGWKVESSWTTLGLGAQGGAW
jgi:hypothetical protein